MDDNKEQPASSSLTGADRSPNTISPLGDAVGHDDQRGLDQTIRNIQSQVPPPLNTQLSEILTMPKEVQPPPQSQTAPSEITSMDEAMRAHAQTVDQQYREHMESDDQRTLQQTIRQASGQEIPLTGTDPNEALSMPDSSIIKPQKELDIKKQEALDRFRGAVSNDPEIKALQDKQTERAFELFRQIARSEQETPPPPQTPSSDATENE